MITTSVLNIYCKPVNQFKASKVHSRVKVDVSTPAKSELGLAGLSTL